MLKMAMMLLQTKMITMNKIIVPRSFILNYSNKNRITWPRLTKNDFRGRFTDTDGPKLIEVELQKCQS